MNFKKLKKIIKPKIYQKATLVKLAIVAILLLIFAIAVSKSPQLNLTNEQIISKLGKFEEVKVYKDLNPQIKHLDKKALSEQAKRYPVIYKELSGDIYEVRYSSGNSGILLLYDAESDKILKTFNLLDWKQ